MDHVRSFIEARVVNPSPEMTKWRATMLAILINNGRIFFGISPFQRCIPGFRD